MFLQCAKAPPPALSVRFGPESSVAVQSDGEACQVWIQHNAKKIILQLKITGHSPKLAVYLYHYFKW